MKIYYFSLTTVIFLLDRVSKYGALNYCLDFPYILNRFISFQVVFNRGISWGVFDSSPTLLIAIIVGIQCCILFYLTTHAYKDYLLQKNISPYIAIITGTLCNMLDRFLYGYVVDFISIGCNNFSWPIFNVADIAIVVGVFILLSQAYIMENQL